MLHFFTPPLFARSAFLNRWLLGVAFFFLIFWTFLGGTIRALESRTWPSTVGHVTAASIQKDLANDSEREVARYLYEPIVRYYYAVDGRIHEGKRIAIGGIAGSLRYATSVLAKYPKGSEVTVYYHPRLHSLAVLEPGRFVAPLIGALLSGAVLCGVGWLWVGHSLHPKQSPWDQPPTAASGQ